MFSLFIVLAVAATCPKTELVGFEDGMTQDDQDAFTSAKKRCAEIYPEAPCLKKFVKRGELNYWAICGVDDK